MYIFGAHTFDPTIYIHTRPSTPLILNPINRPNRATIRYGTDPLTCDWKGLWDNDIYRGGEGNQDSWCVRAAITILLPLSAHLPLSIIQCCSLFPELTIFVQHPNRSTQRLLRMRVRSLDRPRHVAERIRVYTKTI